MTEKQIVKEFLDFLNTHNGYIALKSGTSISYDTLRSAIVNTLQLALNDGYDAGYKHCDNMIHWDSTIFSRKEE